MGYYSGKLMGVQAVAAPAIVTDGLVLHLDAGNATSYPGSGTTWYDLSGNAKHATLVSGVGYDSQNNGSLVFDGTNDYGHISMTPISGSSSLVFFIKTSATDNGVFYYANGVINKATYDRQVYINKTGKIEFRFWKAGITGNCYGWLNSLTSINDNSWKQIAIINDISFGKKIYINGVLDNSDSTPYSGYNGYTMPYFHIGVSTDNSEPPSIKYLQGNIANVFMYNKALSATEITQNYNALKTRYGL